MPKNYYRLEVRTTRALKQRLETLRQEFEKVNGVRVTMSNLVTTLLVMMVERMPEEENEEVFKLYLQLIS